MPKGQVEKDSQFSFGVTCHKKGTTRIFMTQKELKTYLKRHDKVCDCGKSEYTGMVYDYESRQKPLSLVNEL